MKKRCSTCDVKRAMTSEIPPRPSAPLQRKGIRSLSYFYANKIMKISKYYQQNLALTKYLSILLKADSPPLEGCPKGGVVLIKYILKNEKSPLPFQLSSSADRSPPTADIFTSNCFTPAGLNGSDNHF